MQASLSISAVKYINTLPYIEGLHALASEHAWDISLDTPAECAVKMREGTADVGLVPIVAIPQLKEYKPIQTWGIGGDGEVYSVVLLSEVPIEEVEAIYLDYQSNTSNALLSVLLQDYFSSDTITLQSAPGYEKQIRDKVAGLIIGDRVFDYRRRFPFVYDLSWCWKEYSQLPFVFAQWIARNETPADVVEALDHAFRIGMTMRDDIARRLQPLIPEHDIDAYLHQYICYELDEQFRKGSQFFEKKRERYISKLTS